MGATLSKPAAKIATDRASKFWKFWKELVF